MHISELATNNDLAEGGAPKIVRNRLRADVWVVEVNGSHGSGHAGHRPGFIAEKQPLKLRFPEAADRQCAQATRCGLWLGQIKRLIAVVQ
jgi:hypothetical protein